MTTYVKHNEQSFEVAKSGMLCMVTPMINLETLESILDSKSNKSWNASVAIVREQMTSKTRKKVGNFCLRFKLEDVAHAKRIASAFATFAKKSDDAKLARVYAKRADKIFAWIDYVS